MRPIAEMTRSIRWGFAAAGAVALVAAAVTWLAVASPAFATGAAQLLAGVLLLVAAFRVPGGIRSAVPFLGAAVAGVVLGGSAVVLPSLDPRIALIAIGIWAVVAGAGYLAVARIARACGFPTEGSSGSPGSPSRPESRCRRCAPSASAGRPWCPQPPSR